MARKKSGKQNRLLHVGGNANNGSLCGLSASNANNAFSNSNPNIGARLAFNRNKKNPSMRCFALPSQTPYKEREKT